MLSNETNFMIIDKQTQFIQLKRNQYYLAEKCFPLTYPNISFIKSVFENRISANVYVNSLEYPEIAVVLTTGPFGFVSPNYNVESIRHIGELFEDKISKIHDFKLIIDKSIFNLNNQFTMDQNVIIERLHFDFNKITDINYRPPQGVTLHSIDNILFEKCNWRELMLSFYGSKGQCLLNSAGFCLLKENKVISEAHAIISNDFAEFGVFTDSNYRKMGFSSIVCNALISYCLNKGLSLKWSCNAVNEISHKLALKLGFDNAQSYHALISSENH